MQGFTSTVEKTKLLVFRVIYQQWIADRLADRVAMNFNNAWLPFYSVRGYWDSRVDMGGWGGMCDKLGLIRRSIHGVVRKVNTLSWGC